MVAELITELIPGAGPPLTIIPKAPRVFEPERVSSVWEKGSWWLESFIKVI
jgi:hypothetical protein